MSMKSLAALVVVAAVTALFLWLGGAQLEAPAVRANTGFDQARAFETLSRLLAEQQPHVAGSRLNAVVRDRIRAELTAHGYESELQSALQCETAARYAGCTQVENIIAVHKGSRPGKALLVTAHYDSVPAGPGVGDDGAGTAIVLEFARQLATRATKNDVIFLITDGEETGLRGAYAFAKRHPLMKQVGLILNFEARGASGPSLMFETGPGNAKLIDLFANTVASPYANSLLYEIYRLMPNDTDFSVYRRAGYNGFNFAFTGSGALYHSERDNLANLDRGTLQHHGDNLFALGTALADADLDALKSTSDASYFDLFGTAMIVWPAALNLPLALIALIGIVALIVAQRSAFALSALVWATLAVFAAPLLLFAAGWLLSYPLGIWPGVHPIDHPAPWPPRIALAAAAIAVALGVTGAARRADPRALLLVVGIAFAGVGVALAWFVTGASYLFVFPALVLAAAGWIETALRRNLIVTPWATFVVVAYFWLPFAPRLDLVLSFALSQYKILALTPFVWALSPVFAGGMPSARQNFGLATIAALFVGAWSMVAAQGPAYTETHPRGLNVIYLDDRSSSPQWLIDFVGAPDETYLKATGFPAQDAPYQAYGVRKAEGRLKPAADQKLEAPSLSVTEVVPAGGLAVARGVVRPARGGIRLAFAVKPGSGIRAISVAGQELLGPARLSGKDPVIAPVLGWGARDLPIEISYDPTSSPSLHLIEGSTLPDGPEGQALLAARPKDAAPAHFGNSAVVIVKIDLPPAGP